MTGDRITKQTIEFPAAPSFFSAKKWINLIPKIIGNRKKRLCVRLRSGDKHHLRKSSDRKTKIRKEFFPLTGLICAFRSADFLRWWLSLDGNLTHNIFFYFQHFLALIFLSLEKIFKSIIAKSFPHKCRPSTGHVSFENLTLELVSRTFFLYSWLSWNSPALSISLGFYCPNSFQVCSTGHCTWSQVLCSTKIENLVLNTNWFTNGGLPLTFMTLSSMKFFEFQLD